MRIVFLVQRCALRSHHLTRCLLIAWATLRAPMVCRAFRWIDWSTIYNRGKVSIMCVFATNALIIDSLTQLQMGERSIVDYSCSTIEANRKPYFHLKDITFVLSSPCVLTFDFLAFVTPYARLREPAFKTYRWHGFCISLNAYTCRCWWQGGLVFIQPYFPPSFLLFLFFFKFFFCRLGNYFLLHGLISMVMS